jgi:hypothetical protein
MHEMTDPYDLPFPDRWPHRPEYVIVVAQLRDWQPGQPPSLAELLETRPARTREPEPDLEADQIDRADAMLAGLHDRARHGRTHAEQAWPDIEGPRITALARQDPETQTVTLVLDATTASIALFAIAAHAGEREAHVREVQQFSRTLPEDSYARRNRQGIAARETRIVTRLRAVEHACQTAIDRDTTPTSPEPAQPFRSPEHAAAGEFDLEAEP